MQQFLIISLFISMAATLSVMVAGIFCMAKGGDFNKKHGNKLMQLRVTCQAVALASLAALMMMKD